MKIVIHLIHRITIATVDSAVQENPVLGDIVFLLCPYHVSRFSFMLSSKIKINST